MIYLIIFGTRGVTYGNGEGQFHCPDCDQMRPYKQKRVRRFFTLYFIPLIPLDLVGEYVECSGCGSSYKPAVLDYKPESSAPGPREEAAFRVAMRRVLVLMMLADGKVEESEVGTILGVLGGLEKRVVTRDEIDAEIRAAQAQPGDIEGYCKTMQGVLNDAGKEMVIRAAYQVANADGDFASAEKETLARIAGALGMSKSQFAGVLDQVKAAA